MADMRLMDANALAMGLAEYTASNAYLNDTALDVLKMVAKWVETSPTIDAVSVVRCRECNNTKWWPTPKDTIFCDKWGEWMPCNGFCHMGTKMDGGDRP